MAGLQRGGLFVLANDCRIVPTLTPIGVGIRSGRGQWVVLARHVEVSCF